MNRRTAMLALLLLPAFLVALPGSATAAGANTECNGTLAPGTYKNVFVPEGADCITSDGVVITGNFMAKKSPGVIELIDTPVGHNLMVDGASDHVTIGTQGCVVDPHVGNNIKVTDSNDVAICQMSVDNNMMVTGNTGRVMVRDNLVCQNIRVVRNALVGLRVLRNGYAIHLVTDPNSVSKVTRIEDNVEIEHKGCRAMLAGS